MFTLTSENMKKAEDSAVKDGATFYDLMDTAGTKCAEFISNENKSKKAVILCGKGKNGGDGLVIAERLCQNGFKKVFVILINGKITEPICLKMFERMIKYPVNTVDMTENDETAFFHISTAEIIIDSIFGIGFKGELSGNAAEAVKAANKNTFAKKYAIDIPSGLTADGKYLSQLFFNTDVTLTMIAFKPVHVLNETKHLCGETNVIKIGVEEKNIAPFAEKYLSYTKSEIKQMIKTRMPDDNKGSYGKILTVCGSKNMTGCVYLCNTAAVESGAGLVTASFPDCIYTVAASKLNEAVMLPLPTDADGMIDASACKIVADKINNYSAIAVGCGIGINKNTKSTVKFILENAVCPVILDADALNCIAKDISVLDDAKCPVLITPHPGEMARLTGLTISEIQSDRMNIAADFAKKHNITVLLKGNGTVIADSEGKIAINTTGNPGMARGGSGDVLTGIIAALVPQTKNLFEAAAAGAFIHGYVADELKKEGGILYPTPSRTAKNIYRFFR